MLYGSWVSGYLYQLDHNYIDNFDWYITYTFAVVFNIVLVVAMMLVLITSYITGTYPTTPAIIIMIFIQTIYYSLMSGIEIP